MDNTTESPGRSGPVVIDERAKIEPLEAGDETGCGKASRLHYYHRDSGQCVKSGKSLVVGGGSALRRIR